MSESSNARIVRKYFIRPKPSEETARSTFIHPGIVEPWARKRRAMFFQEKECSVRSITRS